MILTGLTALYFDTSCTSDEFADYKLL